VISFDTNLLLDALNQDCAEYSDARAFFALLPTALGTVLICELVLVELYVLLRNPAVLKHPLIPADAVSLIRTFRQHPTWALVDYPGDTATVMDGIWRWAAQPNIGRRVVFDARLALTLSHHGVTDFATRNERHFAGFGFVRVWNPLPTDESRFTSACSALPDFPPKARRAGLHGSPFLLRQPLHAAKPLGRTARVKGSAEVQAGKRPRQDLRRQAVEVSAPTARRHRHRGEHHVGMAGEPVRGKVKAGVTGL
jgi:toxin-antitoxin system PIN domain toxin